MGLTNQQLVDSVLAGGGETGALMRAMDWSKTDLGPVEQWPTTLRAGVQIVLGAGHPMLISWGPNYIMLYNDAYGVVVGNKHPGALGASCRDVLAEAWDYIGPRFDAVYKDGQCIRTLSHQMFTFHRKHYLEECYFAFSYSPVPDDEGRIGGVLTNALDMTDRVIDDRRIQVLRDLASRTAEARHEEEVWRISTETLREHAASTPFAFLYEYLPAERQARLVGVSTETDLSLHPEVIDCESESLWKFRDALKEESLVVQLDGRASTVSIPGWPTRPVEATVLPIRLRDRSEAVGFAVLCIHPGREFDEGYRKFVRRISEQIAIGLASARAYEQERKRAEALAEIDRAKTAFFSNVSHEFRTPLALMLGPLEEVLPVARDKLSPAHHEQLVTVRRSAFRLLKLVNTLLDFSRIEAGRVQAIYEPTDLGLMTSEIASVFRSAMEKAGLQYSVECESLSEPVYVDRDMWEKIVSNLLSNAFKFTFTGAVTVKLRPREDVVVLQVSDTGVGIPADQLERVFERFHRIEGTQARTFEGTGIGLSLVQELAKLHGGSVRVESVFGVGSTFEVTIPGGAAHLPAERIQSARSMTSTAIGAAAYAEEAERWLPEEWGTTVQGAMLQGSATAIAPPRVKEAAKRELIVVVDDNADMRQYLTHLLGDYYEVRAAPDGLQALEVTRQLRPALVLADVMMPGLDGFGLLREIRSDPAVASTPVILVSARAGEESRVEGLQAGADDYLVKPFTARELLARVESHLKLSSLRREISDREERMRLEAELDRQKLRATEDRLAETRRLYTELQNREAKIRRLVDANIVGVVIWEFDGRILDANDAFLRMIGYGRDELSSGALNWRRLIPPEWLDRDERQWIPQLKAMGRVSPLEKEFLRKDGGRIPVLMGAATFEEIEGQGVAFALDLTDRKRAAESLREAQMGLAHANRLATLGQLAASIAHEVNQPIGAARNNAHAALHFLARDPPDLGEIRETLESVVIETYRAGDIISRIRNQVKKLPPHTESIDLNDAIEEVVTLVRAELTKHRVTVHLEFQSDLPAINGDRIQIQQVMLNLIINAVEAMSTVAAGKRELTICTQVDAPERVSVVVRDTGPGVAPELRERIFESFFTTKSGGIGIGLSICRNILETYSGRLWVEAHEPNGATFNLTLPTHV